MAEAVIGLVGLAASVVTFLDASSKILTLLHECKASSKSNRFEHLELQLPLVSETFKSLEKDIKDGKIDGPAADALKAATEGCLRQALVIQEHLTSAVKRTTRSKMKLVFGAMKRVQEDKKVVDAWRILETYQATISVYLARALQIGENSSSKAASKNIMSFNVPSNRVRGFVGRQNLLGELKATLYCSLASGSRVAVIHGKCAMVKMAWIYGKSS